MGEVGVTKEAGKRKVVSWIHSLGLLVDAWMSEWVVAEKAIWE